MVDDFLNSPEGRARIQAVEFLAKVLEKEGVASQNTRRAVQGLVSQTGGLYEDALTRPSRGRTKSLDDALKAFVNLEQSPVDSPERNQRLGYIKSFLHGIHRVDGAFREDYKFSPDVQTHHQNGLGGTYTLTGDTSLDDALDFNKNLSQEGFLTEDELFWLRDQELLSFDEAELRKPQRQSFSFGATDDNIVGISQPVHARVAHMGQHTGNTGQFDGSIDAMADVNNTINEINRNLKPGEAPAGNGMREALAIPLLAREKKLSQASLNFPLERQLQQEAVDMFNRYSGMGLNIVVEDLQDPGLKSFLEEGFKRVKDKKNYDFNSKAREAYASVDSSDSDIQDLARRANRQETSAMSESTKSLVAEPTAKVTEEVKRRIGRRGGMDTTEPRAIKNVRTTRDVVDTNYLTDNVDEMTRLMSEHRPGTERTMEPLLDSIPGLRQVVSRRLR